MKNYSLKILITGAQGQVGSALIHHSKAKQFQLLACTKNDFNITNFAAINKQLTHLQPDIVINTAAYTAVDKAETEIDACLQTNHIGVKNLAIACREHCIPLIHLSTDYVFDGQQSQPYTEDNVTQPLNIYGKSKLLGEQAIQQHYPQHIILRISGVFSPWGNNFAKTMLRLAKQKTELKIVSNQFTCPTSANDIANAIFTMLEQELQFGIYHYCSTPATSWFDFASSIIDQAKLTQDLMVKNLLAIPAHEFPTAATRPNYSVLNCDKINNVFGIKQPSWQEAIKHIVKDIA